MISDYVSRWTFDTVDVSVPTVNDVGTGGNNGTLVGSPSIVAGKIGQAVSLNGTSQDMTVADNNSLSVTTGITLAGWVKVTDLTDYRYLFEKDSGSSGTREYQLYINKTSGILTFVVQTATGGGQVIYNSTSGVSAGSWAHVAITYDGANIRSYINGVADATVTPCTTSFGNTTRPLTIGYGGSTWYMKGLLDDLRLYNRALSGAEITDLYNFTGSNRRRRMLLAA